ncbi:hypothetical protein O1611_g3324 [Lasiodiplodia mahajangana]|uniref:Uncharacterized protein n=1 Tax=Lasiodiplodia mahajangana TaxID=1108764 RepID=A0ACC2JSA4_9PEZI|nr:hypothetical protein O1611_g3324 [Lasiodiplodia mahajangana]
MRNASKKPHLAAAWQVSRRTDPLLCVIHVSYARDIFLIASLLVKLIALTNWHYLAPSAKASQPRTCSDDQVHDHVSRWPGQSACRKPRSSRGAMPRDLFALHLCKGRDESTQRFGGAAVTGAAANTAATNGAAQDVQAAEVPADPTPAEGTVAAQGSETVVPTTEATSAAADPGLQEQAQQITALQGLGKEIAPREGEEQPKAKRDLQGFDRALTFAEAALTKGPIIQLGTGEGGAGVGIIVDNRPTAAAAEGAAKRDETSQPRRRAKVTRMYVKRGIPAAIQSSPDFKTRSVESLPVLNLPALSKRDSSEAIDAINLNIPADEGVTMTFVETTDDDDEQEVVASK